MSSANEVELAALDSSSKTGEDASQNFPAKVKVDPSQENVKPVSVRTLFFKYATNKEIAFLFLGFFCTFSSLRITDSCNPIRSVNASLPHLLWRIVR